MLISRKFSRSAEGGWKSLVIWGLAGVQEPRVCHPNQGELML